MSLMVLPCRLWIVDGNWSEWSSWEECTRSCGRGNRTRTRTCNNPSVQHGGRPCEGTAVETIMCNVRPCPGKNPEISPYKGVIITFSSLLGRDVMASTLEHILYVHTSVSWMNLWRCDINSVLIQVPDLSEHERVPNCNIFFNHLNVIKLIEY